MSGAIADTDLVQDGQPRWQRRVRNALQHAKRAGRAHRVATGVWAIAAGTAARPRHVLLILLTGTDQPTHLELLLADAAELLRSLDEPADLILGDPFVGSGTTALVCVETGRRFIGGDLNPQAIRFVMARLLAEHLWEPRQLALDLTGHATPTPGGWAATR